MPVAQITNPHGAFGQDPVADQQAESFRCVSVAINRFDLVTLGWDATNQEVTAKATDTDTDTAGLAIGVALEDIPVGGKGLVQLRGLAYVDVGANAPAAGNGLVGSADAGIATGAALAVGHRGVFLAAKSTYFGVANLAPVWLGL